MIPTPPQSTHGLMARSHLWLARHRWLALSLTLALWLCAFGLAQSGIKMDNSSLAFFPDSDVTMTRMAEGMDMAPFSRLLVVDIGTTNEGQAAQLASVADAVWRTLPQDMVRRAAEFQLPDPTAFMRLLPALVDEAALGMLETAVQPKAMQTSMTEAHKALSGLWGNVSVPWIRQDPLNFRRIFLDKLPAPPGVSLSDPTLGFPLSRDGKHVLLTLRPTTSFHDVEQASILMDALNTALAAHVPPDMKATVVGGHRHSAMNAQTIKGDISHIVLFSLAGFALVYATLVRSLRGAFWLLLTPLAAASLALAGVGLSWPLVSGLALGFGASVLGIAEDYAVHMHFALRHAQARGKARGEHIAAALDHLALPLFQGFLLNATGFAVLLFSGIPALRHLAGFALLTLGAGLLLALFVLPLCPGFDAPPLQPKLSRHAKKPRLPQQPRTLPVMVCVLALLCCCALLGRAVNMDISPRSMGAGIAAMHEDGTLLKNIWGTTTEQLWVVRGAHRQETLENARRVAQALRAQGQEVDSLSDLWPAPEVMQANMQRWQDFVQRHPALVQDLTRLGAAQGFAAHTFDPLQQWLAESPQTISEKLLRSAGLQDMLDTFLEENTSAAGQPRTLGLIMAKASATDTVDATNASLLPPSLQHVTVALSPAALEAALLQHLARERWLLPVAGLLCAALLLLCLRSWRWAMLAALPPLAALAAIVAWLAASHTPLTLAGMAALPLVLGLAVDHGVVVSHDLAHGLEHGVDRAIVVSSLTALTGMGLLALAEHPALRSMGQIIFVGLVVEMLAALWLLPLLSKAQQEQRV